MLKIKISYECEKEIEIVQKALTPIIFIERCKKASGENGKKKVYITGKLRKYN